MLVPAVDVLCCWDLDALANKQQHSRKRRAYFKLYADGTTQDKCGICLHTPKSKHIEIYY